MLCKSRRRFALCDHPVAPAWRPLGDAAAHVAAVLSGHIQPPPKPEPGAPSFARERPAVFNDGPPQTGRPINEQRDAAKRDRTQAVASPPADEADQARIAGEVPVSDRGRPAAESRRPGAPPAKARPQGACRQRLRFRCRHSLRARRRPGGPATSSKTTAPASMVRGRTLPICSASPGHCARVSSCACRNADSSAMACEWSLALCWHRPAR